MGRDGVRATAQPPPASRPASPTRVRLESLTCELESRGLSSQRARSLSAEFLIRHPFARRLGMRRLIQEMEQRGLEPHDAPGTAGLLIGIELRDCGASLDQVIADLESMGLSHAEALASGITSARIHRDICEGVPQPEVADAALKALAWFGVGILLLAICARWVG